MKFPGTVSRFSPQDLSSGLFVSLIALPLCLGISAASGFPPGAGLVTAIVGGIITGFLGGAPLTIKGPAAGLIVIVLGAVQELTVGGDTATACRQALAIGVVSAVLQVGMGLLKAGVLTELIPLSVIHGMLSGIGIILVGKQIHVLLGVTPEAKEPLHLLLEIPHSLANLNPAIALIGLVSLLIMLFAPYFQKGVLKKVPSVLFVMGAVFVISNGHEFRFLGVAYHVDPHFFVNLPASLGACLSSPDWSQITSFVSIKYIVLFTIIGSIESCLTVSAVNTIDPMRRRASVNSDLFAVGCANLVAGMLGGIPMISEAVRSKTNVDVGAQSAWSNTIHGLLLLAYLVLLGAVLDRIPLAALAGILVYIGLRLAHPVHFKHAYHAGLEQFICFATTCAITVSVDLLAGVGIGLLLASLFHFWLGSRPRDFLFLRFSVTKLENALLAKIEGPATFSNFFRIRPAIEAQLHGAQKVTFDLSGAPVVDHSFLEKIDEFKGEYAQLTVEKIGLEDHKNLSHHPNGTRVHRR